MSGPPPARFKIVKKTPQEIAEAQAKREAEMREREARRAEEEAAKKAAVQAAQAEKHKDRLDSEAAERERKVAELAERDRAGENIQGDDWLKNARKEAVAQEKARQAEYKAASQAASSRRADVSAEDAAAVAAAASKQKCQWGCSCPGYEDKAAAAKGPAHLAGPPMCAHCNHAKSLHK